jgi:tetratricopeptide (TPR) repeat protein
MQKVIQRRLNQVPASAFRALETAAVIGRAVDANLLRVIYPHIDFEEWAAQCAAAAVLEFRDQQWQFAHDKLRDQVLENLPAPARQLLHRQAAEAIEVSHPGEAKYVTALADHWRDAGEPAREANWAREAGFLALRSGACQEAIRYLTRTLELLAAPGEQVTPGRAARANQPTRWAHVPRPRFDPNKRVDPDSDSFRLGTVEAGLAEAYFRLGDLTLCREHGERALVRFGYQVPRAALGWTLDVARQAAVRGVQEALRLKAADGVRARRVTTEVARAQTKIIESCFYALRLSPLLAMSLRLLNQCAPAGESPALANAYMFAAIIAGAVPAPRLAERWSRRALALAERAGGPGDVAWTLSRSGVLQIATCQWDLANGGLRRAAGLAEEVGDVRLWAECLAQLGGVGLYSGSFQDGLSAFHAARQLGHRSGNPQAECWGLMGEGDCLVRTGCHEDAIPLYREANTLADETAFKTEAIWANSMLGLAQLRSGNREAAYEAAVRALAYLREAAPVAFWIQPGMAATAEVFLLLLESGWRAEAGLRPTLVRASHEACSALRRFARRFPLGQAHAALWEGLRLWLAGRHSGALRLWRRASTAAGHLHTRYELARANLEIGRHLPAGDPRRSEHLRTAVEIFEQLGCVTDLQWTQAEMAEPGSAVVPSWLQP